MHMVCCENTGSLIAVMDSKLLNYMFPVENNLLNFQISAYLDVIMHVLESLD